MLLAALFFILILLILSEKSKTKNLPPGPRKLPIIGDLHLFSTSYPIHNRLRDLSKKYGGVMYLKLGQVPTIVIGTPEAAKEMMKTNDVCFADRPNPQSSALVTYNFLDIAYAPYGDYWRQLRKICIVELLSTKRVQSFRSIREEEVANRIRDISSSSGKPFNLSKRIFALTYGITASEMRTRLMNARDEADRVIESIINDHRANKKTTGETDDIVNVLLKLQDNGNLQFSLTNTSIKAVILDIFIAGSETSSTTVEWAMSEVLKNPRILRKAQEELRKVFDKKGKVDEEGLQEINYLKLIIKETLRMHPPGPLLIPRECRESCELNGYKIPAKAKVIVNSWALARDPNYWTEPDTFYPERFLDSTVDFKGNNYEFIPFGAGRRICPGISFATPTIELPLANFLYHFDWQLPGGMKLENLDMSDGDFGTTVRRRSDLLLIPVSYNPPSLEG
ncbi:hypothetical protein JCGZ_20288 [Jatropha curcas]|uniref:Cytochrome P450 n=1 Tax=Jatropha curcas TaxID=180498 RepID=A0A067K4Y0_JATCU|nr:hypothetical protein JCGZ_20288 [Jatropha curcas]